MRATTISIQSIDIDLLRTLALVVETGGFAKAAERVGRSQSAISLRMKKLEADIGRPIFQRNGRNAELTETGELVASHALRILRLNDDLVSAIEGLGVEGSIRLGISADLAETWLPSALATFVRSHPRVHIAARVDRNAELIEQVARGEIDVAVVFSTGDVANSEFIAELPVHWIGRRDTHISPDENIPLVLFDSPCMFRQIGISALDAAHRGWRVTVTSTSLAGACAAIEAGLGIGIRTRIGLSPALVALDNPNLPVLKASVQLRVLTGSNPSAAALLLKSIAMDTLRQYREKNS